ncbi:MAG: glycoside hydrolase family 88 protein [Lachnospiraceae bacterium]|nr:glycoside hydrolase family 88 protein [Lachnospiraceae bacterium]
MMRSIWQRRRLMFKRGVIIASIAMLVTNGISGLSAYGSPVEDVPSISVEDTANSVNTVRSLAADLQGENDTNSRNANFTWDSESRSNPKNRSWSYFNGIMMDAFLMLDDAAYHDYVETYYNANIGTNKVYVNGADCGYVSNVGASKNYYYRNELDSIPPTRAMFDLIRSGSANSGKYLNMIEYVYTLMQESGWVVPGTGGNFIHKRNNSNWSTYQIALDGIYMAQPFFMELANAADDGLLQSNNTLRNLNSSQIYNDVCSRMLWIGENLYDSSTGLYEHGYNPATGQGNGHFWSRAIGWYAAALADVISMLPSGYESQRAALIDIEKQLFDGMIRYQDAGTGMWYNVTNRDASLGNNRLESSGTALMAYSMMKLFDEGYVDETYGEAGLRAFNGTVAVKMQSGSLTDVYKSSGVSTSDGGYLTSTYETDEAKGVGPLMMAACYANGTAAKLQKAEPKVTAPAAAENLVYNGKDQELVKKGTAVGGTMYYALGKNSTAAPEAGENDNETWTKTVPQAEATGTYYVWYKVTGDQGYKDTAPACVTASIKKKDLTIRADSASREYTGSALTVSTYTNTELAAGDAIASVDIAGSQTDVGSSRSEASNAVIRRTEGSGSDVTKNYNISYVPGTLTVTKASNPVSVSMDGWTYGETAKTPDASAPFGSDQVVYTYSDSEDGPFTDHVPDHAGTWYVKASVPGTDNYEGFEVVTSFVIAKAPITPAVSMEDWAYGEEANEPSVTGNTGEGAVTYAYKAKDGDDSTYTEKVPAGAGAYTVRASVAETADYEAGTAAADFTVHPKPVKIVGLSAADKVYDGTDLAKVTGTPRLEKAGRAGLLGSVRTAVTGGAVEAGDEVAVDYGTAAFDSADAGNDKPVTFSGFALSGASASNYSLTAQPEGTRANITKRQLTIAAEDQTIREGDSIEEGAWQIAGGTPADGHSVSSAALGVSGSEIVPSDAVITDGSGGSVTDNYDITYRNGALTVISKVTRTVTFKVANGLWNDGTADDKTVTLSGYEGEELKLEAGAIPSAGERPSENFRAGSWDAEPAADTAVTEDKTYTYTYAAADPDPQDPDPQDPDPQDPDPQDPDPGHSDSPRDGAVTITGLSDSDTVKLYQVIGWEDGTGWKLLEPFTGIAPWASDLTDNKDILVNTDIVNEINGRITGTTKAVETESLHPKDGTFTAEHLEPGMYIAIVTAGVTEDPDNPGAPNTSAAVYNPIIVSTDFDSDGIVNAEESDIPISRSEDYGGNTSVAKKTTVTLDKTAEDRDDHDGNKEETVAVGDEVTFTVSTVIPPFVTYLHPAFVITDEMSEGLKYIKGSVSVTEPAGLSKGTEYEVTDESDEGVCGYTLSFSDSYLKSLAVNTPVTITYKAEVTSDAAHSLNHEVNTVTLEFSNNPHDDSGRGKLKDRTNHYTFDIDAELLGNPGYEATEIVKVGVDADGNEILESTTLSNTGVVGALQGAEFALYKARVRAGSDDEWEKEWSDPVIEKITSGADGRLRMTGLDAGKYLLVETKAPAGYIKDSDPVKIEITAQVEPKTYVEDGCTIKTDELVSYTVTVNGAQTAGYTIRNSSDPAETSADRGDTTVGLDGDKGKIRNTKGTALPNTGGPGTTLFYLLGAILAGLAGAGLAVKKRKRNII